VPQVIGAAQAFVARQSISHRDASEQSMPPRQLLEPHTTRQGKPAGHWTPALHELFAEQSRTHSLPLHVPGQLASQSGSVPPVPPDPPLLLPSADASGVEESAGPLSGVPASGGDPPPPAALASTGDAPPVEKAPPPPPGPAPPVTGLASGCPARPPAASGSCALPLPPDRS
jgi:hypothetical protein